MSNENTLKSKVAVSLPNPQINMIFKASLLLCFAFVLSISGKSSGELREFSQAQAEFDNGNYRKAIELAELGVEKGRKGEEAILLTKGLDIIASSEIALKKFKEAEDTLDESLKLLSEYEAAKFQKAVIYTRFAWLYRSQRKFAEAVDYSKKAVAVMPDSLQIQAEHYLNLGRILFASGYDVSAIIWLEKAEKLLEAENTTSTKLDVYKFLTLAWSSKLNYQAALKYAEKRVSSAKKTQFKSKYRQGLFDHATTLSSSGQEKRAIMILEKGLKLSAEENDSYQGGIFLTSLLLHSLSDGDKNKASGYLNKLEKIDADNLFSFEIKLGKAIIFAFQGQQDISENFLPNWKNKKPLQILYCLIGR